MRIGIDLGGSHIGIGIIQDDKIIDLQEKNFTREDKANIEKTIINETSKIIIDLCKKNDLNLYGNDIDLIGIASPGTILNGKIAKARNLGLNNFDIIKELKNALCRENDIEEKIEHIKFQIRNDAKCAGLAEKKYGAMKNYEDCVFLTIGTGIGGAIFMNGELLMPKMYSGFELGHIVINKGGRLCTCGKRGCFETYASIKALKTKVTETLNMDSNISGEFLREVVLKKELFENKNEAVIQDVDNFLEYLQVGICNLIDIFEPEIVVLGGSFSYYEGNPIYDMLIKKINSPKTTFNGDISVKDNEEKNKRVGLPKITLAKLKNNAGMIGATL